MPASKSNIESKVDRLRQLEILLLAHPEGMSQSEAARLLGVNRSTVYRYTLADPHIQVDDTGWMSIDRRSYNVDVRYSLHEAMALHLAGRLLASRLDRHNPHAASAMRKLGLALTNLAPMVSQALVRSADVLDSDLQWMDPTYRACLERLAEAWAAGRKVRLSHRSVGSGEINQYVFSLYFIEPGSINQATYAIGYSDSAGAIRTFKIERLEDVEILDETYTIPDNFDADRLIGRAWGIWLNEGGDTREVVLRFSAKVAYRLKETRWHRSQEMEEEPDGSVIWRAWVTEPYEMMYWIRGWGPEVEVLEPSDLRAELIAEIRRLGEMYLPDAEKASP